MGIQIVLVESDKGRRRIRPLGVAALLAVSAVSFLAIPALIFRLALGVTPTSGFLTWQVVFGSMMFGSILGSNLRHPLEKLPKAATTDLDD